jgi:hypothetical protein
MANDFLTATLIANRGLATLYNNIVLAGLVSRDFDSSFDGKSGDVVNVRTPAVFEADEYDRDDGLNVQAVEEGSVPVTLNKVADVSVGVTSEELSLDIDNFAEQVMNPAMEAIAQKVDQDIAAALTDGSTAPAGGTPAETVVNARTALSENKVPNSDRYCVWSPDAAGELLKDELFVRADASGSTDGLIEASIGRKLGFDHFESHTLASNGVAFHRTAVTLASRTLSIPLGKTGDQAAVANYKGLGLRVVRDYDIDQKQDVISVDFLYGVAILDSDRAVNVTLGSGS